MNKFWTVWKHALGSFSYEDTVRHEDAIAIIRTCIVGINIIVGLLIGINIIIGWIF